MSKPVYLFMCKIPDADAKARMAQYIEVVEVDDASEAAILANLDGKTGLIVPFSREQIVTPAVLDAGTSLELVGTTYGGTRQNVADTYALEKGLTLIHTGPSRVRPMAEYTLALVLTALTQIHNYHHYMRSGDAWPRMRFGRTRILHKRSVGIVGLGLIGRGIVEILRSFTDDISVRSNHLSDEEAKAMGVQKRDLNTIFAECEVIILAGGYTPETHHMVGAEQFALMQDDALFVNIARGKMVDEAAMTAAVQSRPVFLALDVFEEEPLAANSPLRESDRVLMAPHRANAPIEFEQRWQCLADQIEAFYSDKSPETALTPERARAMSAS